MHDKSDINITDANATFISVCATSSRRRKDNLFSVIELYIKHACI